ncbi:MAG: Hsp20/alpha crystallin family protein [Chloroflexi bacterium]|jgi:HSP20 family protein|nr:Hsp20/alpha crystallin family protein [Anaerolineaceae bacterium]NMB90808.1 Hsp20/alpha crystallin family protein [Chloroflexota bacterium]
MTLYVTTPYQRRMRRMAQMMENQWPEAESSVVFPVDVKAETDGFVVTALLPGVASEDLNVQIVSEAVTIQGEFKNDRNENDSYLLQERPFGRFYRTLTLPGPLDANNVEASLDNGVLTLRVPKAEEARPRMIKINKK